MILTIGDITDFIVRGPFRRNGVSRVFSTSGTMNAYEGYHTLINAFVCSHIVNQLSYRPVRLLKRV